MILHGKGWGWSVFYVSMALLLVVFGGMIVFGVGKDDPPGSDKLFYQICALWLALSAAGVYVVDRYREGKARAAAEKTGGPFVKTQRDDEFLFMAMWAWPYLLLILALACFVASYFV